jgi:Arc/MetJ family transcription regulator
MRTNIVLDEKLLEAAMKAGGFETKKAAVEAGLRLLARKAAYEDIRRLRGRIKWEGDLAEWRTDAPSKTQPTGRRRLR